VGSCSSSPCGQRVQTACREWSKWATTNPASRPRIALSRPTDTIEPSLVSASIDIAGGSTDNPSRSADASKRAPKIRSMTVRTATRQGRFGLSTDIIDS